MKVAELPGNQVVGTADVLPYAGQQAHTEKLQDVVVEIQEDAAPNAWLRTALTSWSREEAAETLRALEPIYEAGGDVICLMQSWLNTFTKNSQGRAELISSEHGAAKQAEKERTA